MSTTGRYFRLLIAFWALLLLPGCGVGALIAGGIVAIVIARNGGSSGGTAPQAFLDASFTRQDLVESGSAEIIPICYRIVGDAPAGQVRVQYSTVPAGDSWRPASSVAGAPAARCGEHTFWWDAAGDLDLVSRSIEVRVRVLVGEDRARADVSTPFFVGNTPHELEILDPEAPVSDELQIRFEARDRDGPLEGPGDRLRDVRLQYRLGEDPDPNSCPGVEPGELPADCEGQGGAGVVGDDGWIDVHRFDDFDASPLGVQHAYFWNTRCAIGIGNRNVEGVELRVVARDGFGVEREDVTGPFSVRNNRPPRITFLGTNPDEQTGFEVPIVLRAEDADGDALDIVLQFAAEGQAFMPLGVELDDCSARRTLLSSSDPGARRELGILTLSGRGPETSMQDLAASESGIKHVLVWDSAVDLGLVPSNGLRLRATAFDGSQRAESPLVSLEVDNGVLMPELSLADGVTVAGLAAGDIDGDGRKDLAVAHTRAGVAGEGSRVAIHLQLADGSFSATEDFSVHPGGEALSTPIGLVLRDLDGDQVLDLVVLNSNCVAGDSCTAIGDVSVYWGKPRPQLAFSDTPDLVLSAGRDLRDLIVGEFDGQNGLDIAVSSHDDENVSVFRAMGGRSFYPEETIDLGGEPGSLAAGNFDGDAEGVLEIVVRKRDAVVVPGTAPGAVDFYRWSPRTEQFQRWHQIAIAGPVSLVARELNGRGLVDLAVGSRDALSVSVYQNNSSPERAEFEQIGEFCLQGSPERFVLADLLGDGRRAVVALERDRQRVEILLEDEALRCCDEPGGCRRSEIPLSIPDQDSGLPASAIAADLDGDARDDLVFGGNLSGARLFRARSAGSLVPELVQSLSLSSDDRPVALFTGNLDSDPLGDFGVAIPPVRGGAPAYGALLFRQGDVGEFSRIPTQTLRSPSQELQSEVQVIADDADGDGRQDYIAMSHEGGIVLFVRDGELFATEPTVSLKGAPPCGSGAPAETEVFPVGPLLAGEFDGEHAREILHFDRGRKKLSLLGVDLAPGEVHVAVQESMCLPGFPESVAAFDMDRDGLADLALLDRSGEVTVRLRDANRPWPASFELVHASLDLAERVGLASTFGDLLAADVDQDGRGDLIVVDSGPGSAKKVWGFRQLPPQDGDGLGAFERSFELDPLEPGERGDFRVDLEDTELIDLTGDGLEDVVVAVESPPSVRLAVFYQDRSGAFPLRPSRTVGLTEELGGRIRVEGVDLSGDSRPELLIAIPGGSELRILRTR